MSPTLDRRRYGATNYVYLLIEGGDAALVDPGDPEVALALAAAHQAAPRWILHTHGHADHTGGSAALAERLGAEVLGHGADAAWFQPGRDLAGQTALTLGALRLRVHHVPGHTPGSLLLECGEHLLTGDTLFTGGCGNCRHGGDVAALARSFLGVLAHLDGALRVHPGHDYAADNLPFVLELEPGNHVARARLDEARARVGEGAEPEAVTLAQERRVNPFLRARDVPSFVDLRARRDGWTGLALSGR
jgi:hydroxyacylglutathione hydrolase